jgi:hypothetical protein
LSIRCSSVHFRPSLSLPVSVGRGGSVEAALIDMRLASCADTQVKTPTNASVQSAAWNRKPMEASSKLLASLASRSSGTGTTRNLRTAIGAGRLPELPEPEINDALSPIYPFDIRSVSDSRIIVGFGGWRP